MQNVKFVLSLFYHFKIFNIIKILKNRGLKNHGLKYKKRKNVDITTFLRLPLEATPGFGPGIRVLQTRALPLGYDAI